MGSALTRTTTPYQPGTYINAGNYTGDADIEDNFRLEFWSSSNGSFELVNAVNEQDGGDNTNYAACYQCLLMDEDMER